MRIPFMILVAAFVATRTATAQNYSCFPNCSQNDGRMLVLAGAGTRTLSGDTLLVRIGARAESDSIEIDVFDGDSGGTWDRGGVALVYTLFADPAADGSGRSVQVAQWSGSSMPDTAWSIHRLANADDARCPSGSYFYVLRIHNPDPSVVGSWSAFKLRTTGALALDGRQAFSVLVPLSTLREADVLYPSGLTNLTTTTYDGTWRFFLHVPYAASSLAIWDGDMDYGSYDCVHRDTVDPDTPKDGLPAWATGTDAVVDTIASGSGCIDSDGQSLGGLATGSPPDDNYNAVFARSPAVSYEIIHPDGRHFVNSNPSGNVEWERFSLGTGSFDRSTMDAAADSLPAGMYEILMHGMDLQNLNAWRLFDGPSDAAAWTEMLGVDTSGAAVAMPLPYSVTGLVYYDVDADGVPDSDEPGIPAVSVVLMCDVNSDGTTDVLDTVETDDDGIFSFAEVPAGTHRVVVDTTTLATDAITPQDDSSAIATSVTITVADGAAVAPIDFGYQRRDANVVQGVGSRGYWTHHPDCWPVTTLSIGGVQCDHRMLMRILRRPTRGDHSYQMAAQLIAAKLNVAAGAPSSCVLESIDDADAWLESYPIGHRSCRREKNAAWRSGGEAIKNVLNDYNNGRLCGSHIE